MLLKWQVCRVLLFESDKHVALSLHILIRGFIQHQVYDSGQERLGKWEWTLSI